jgi:hypothetical protein
MGTVSASSADGVWAVGYSRSTSVQPLILRGEGTSLTLETAVTGSGSNPWLTAAGRGPGGGPWAVGTASNGTSDRTLVLRGPAR